MNLLDSKRTPKENGLSLVELLVALAVSSLLLLGVTSIYFSSRQTDNLGSELARIQETGRQALNLISQDIRMIGYKGCLDADKASPDLNQIFENQANNSGYIDLLDDALRGFEVDNGNWAIGAEFDNTAIEANALLTSDVIAIQKASTLEANLIGALPSNTSPVVLDGNPHDFQVNDLAFITNCDNASIFRVTNAPGAGNASLEHAGTSNTAPDFEAAYDENSRVYRLESIVYFVADTGRVNNQNAPIRALYRQTDQLTNTAAPTLVVEELIEGVENMQILYGEQLANDNIRYVTADNVGDFTSVRSIKIGMLVSSNNEVNPALDNITYDLHGSSVAPIGTAGAASTHAIDRRLRRVFSTTVDIRNR